MRWFLLDRFIEFVHGHRAVAVKGVTMADESIDGYAPGFPHMPATLMIEGMAHAAGFLISEMDGFNQRIVLGKICKAVFHDQSVPGDLLRYEATIGAITAEGAMASVNAYVGDKHIAEVELMLAFLDERFPTGPLFEPVDFARMHRGLWIYDVGQTSDGIPIEMPPWYAAAEHDAEGRFEPIPSPVAPRAKADKHS